MSLDRNLINTLWDASTALEWPLLSTGAPVCMPAKLSLCIRFHRLGHGRDKKASFLFDRAFLRILSRPCFRTVHKCRPAVGGNHTSPHPTRAHHVRD